MDSFSALAVWGVSGLISVLAWRLYTALHSNQDLEVTFSEQLDTLHHSQSELKTLKSKHQFELNALSDELTTLQAQIKQQQGNFEQLTKDHQALQNRHRALEQDLLNQMSIVSSNETQLQNHRLEQANLKQKTEQLEAKNRRLEQENQTYHLALNKAKESLQSAESKILVYQQETQALTSQKNQLERELQRELQRNVALEDQVKLLAPGYFEDDFISLTTESNRASAGPSLPNFTIHG